MKYIRQLLIILFISFMGELLRYIIPLPVPASIYGLILMLAALKTGIVPLSAVEDTAGFLIEIMPLMFIPAAAGLVVSWTQLAPMWIAAVIAAVVVTMGVTAVTGIITQAVIRRKRKK